MIRQKVNNIRQVSGMSGSSWCNSENPGLESICEAVHTTLKIDGSANSRKRRRVKNEIHNVFFFKAHLFQTIIKLPFVVIERISIDLNWTGKPHSVKLANILRSIKKYRVIGSYTLG